MKLRTLIEISVLETRPSILRSPESVERLAFCTASLPPPPHPPHHVSFPRSHIGGDFQILSASVVIQSAGVTTHHYSVFTFNSKRRRLRVVAPRSVSPAREDTANEIREREWKSHHRGRSHAFPSSRLSSHAAIFTSVRVFHSLNYSYGKNFFLCVFF